MYVAPNNDRSLGRFCLFGVGFDFVLFFVARNGFKCSLEIPHMSQFDYFFFVFIFFSGCVVKT